MPISVKAADPSGTKPAASIAEAVAGPLLTTNILFLRLSAFALRVARSVLLLFVALVLLAAALSLFRDVERHRFFRQAIETERAMERPMTAALRRHVPTNFRGADASRWILVMGIYLLSIGLGMTAERFSEATADIRRRSERKNHGAAAPPAQERRSAPQRPPLSRGIEALKPGEKLDRTKLLEIYAQAKKTLAEQKRNLAFLSIDVVDSTGMKIGEDADIAERDFKQYKRLVEKVLEAHGVLKATWTPDGVMICFGRVEDAVGAAQKIIIGLEGFNKNVKVIKRDFAVRAGINAGTVAYDESTPLEEMTDRVIDIAGHMQKHGTVNGVCVAKPAIENFPPQMGFAPTSRVVDGCEVYEWKPEAS